MILLASFASGAHARTWFIRPDGTGDAPTIQAAVDSMAEVGDTLLLASGLYRGPGNRDLLVCHKQLVIRSDSGNPEDCVIDCGAGGGFRFCDTDEYHQEIDGTFIGLTIRNATVGINTASSVDQYVDLTIESCVIEECIANGIRNTGEMAMLSMKDSWVRNNGGAGLTMSSMVGGSIDLRNNVFAGNGGNGLAVNNAHAADCTFKDNGGSGIYLSGGYGSFVDCNFVDNKNGGVHFVRGKGSVSAKRCRFLGNTAIAMGGGLAIIEGSSGGYVNGMTITDCVFSRNAAPKGGAIYCGKLLANSLAPALTGMIRDCTFYENIADEGAFAYIQSDTRAWQPSTLRIQNTIVASHPSGEPLRCEGLDILEVTCSDIFGNPGGDWVGCLAGLDTIPGNISDAPWFCNPEGSDFHLASASPCLRNECDRIGACGEGCVSYASLDMQPGSCPNAFDVGAPGDNMIPAAILGGGWLDVLRIDPATIRLEGVVPPWWGYEDVGSPGQEDDPAACPVARPDGIRDMTLKFNAAEIAAAIGPASRGDVVALTLTASLRDGGEFSATDRVTIVDHRIPALPTHTTLGPAIPNPFNPTTRIVYYLPHETHVDITVYDVAGRVVERILHETVPAGRHEAIWNANGTSSGVYFVRLTTPEGEDTYKLVMMK